MKEGKKDEGGIDMENIQVFNMDRYKGYKKIGQVGDIEVFVNEGKIGLCDGCDAIDFDPLEIKQVISLLDNAGKEIENGHN